MSGYYINIRHLNGILALNSRLEPQMIQSIGEKQSERFTMKVEMFMALVNCPDEGGCVHIDL